MLTHFARRKNDSVYIWYRVLGCDTSHTGKYVNLRYLYVDLRVYELSII
jgi:hypothetical protein